MTECQEPSNNSGALRDPSERDGEDLQQPCSPSDATSNMHETKAEPSHHARRPMNAFLIFCKKHRRSVKTLYPKHENRAITKILGEWWKNIDDSKQIPYKNLAKEYKDAFLHGNPDFKWYKLPAPPLRSSAHRPHSSGASNIQDPDEYQEMLDLKPDNTNNNHLIKYDCIDKPSSSSNVKQGKKPMFTPGKLADEAHMGGLSSLISDSPKPIKQESCHVSSYSVNALSSARVVDPLAIRNDPVLSDKHRRLQEALTETTRSFECFDKSNENSMLEDKSNTVVKSEVKDTCNDSDGTYSGGDDPPKQYNSSDNKYFKHQSSVSSDESQDKDQMYAEFRRDMCDSNNLSRASGRTKKGKRYQEFMEQVGPKTKRKKKEYSDRNSRQLKGNSGSAMSNWRFNAVYCKEQASVSTSNFATRSYESDLPTNDYSMYNSSAYKCKEEPIESYPASYDYEDADNIGVHEGSSYKKYTADDFGLEAKIQQLPLLPLDDFLQKKDALKTKKKNFSSSKRKDTKRTTQSSIDKKHYPNAFSKGDQTILSYEERLTLAQQKKSEITGSKKRKLRKESINRIDVNSQNLSNDSDNTNNNILTKSINNNHTKIIPSASVYPETSHASNDGNNIKPTQNVASTFLCNLATLAEVAAHTSKID